MKSKEEIKAYQRAYYLSNQQSSQEYARNYFHQHKEEDRLIRTPLGGFLNHAEVPNCYKTKLRYTQEDDSKIHYKIWNLIALDDIKEGEELTVTYTFYKI